MVQHLIGFDFDVLSVDRGVGVLTMDSPPVNSLGTELVTSFKEEIGKMFFFLYLLVLFTNIVFHVAALRSADMKNIVSFI